MSDDVKEQVGAILRVLNGVMVIIVAGSIMFTASKMSQISESQAVTASQMTAVAAAVAQLQVRVDKVSSLQDRQTPAIEDWIEFKRRNFDGSPRKDKTQ